jgi:hypothetical protein
VGVWSWEFDRCQRGCICGGVSISFGVITLLWAEIGGVLVPGHRYFGKLYVSVYC